MKASDEKNLHELLTLKEAALLLKCHPNSLRAWDKSGIFPAIRLGERKLLRYRKQDLEMHLTGQTENKNKAKQKSPKTKFSVIKKFLKEHADTIQKLATKEHKRYLGGGTFRSEIIPKYQELHIRIINEFANYLDNKDIGVTLFKNIGKELAKDAVNDDLTIKEAVDGIIFLKQGVWKSLKKEKLLDYLGFEELYQLNLRIGTYCDVIGTQIAFTFHDLATQKKHEAEENLRLILDNVKDFAIMRLDLKGNVIYWNTGAERLFRYSENEILKKNYSRIFAKEENENNKPQRELQSAIKKGSVENENWSIRQDGSQFWGSGTTTALVDKKGKPYGFIKIIRDRTELKELEKQKDEFVSIISHELKNPLTSMMAFTQILQKRLEKSDDQIAIKAIRTIQVQTDKLTDLISNLLERSRVRSKSFIFHDTKFNLDSIILQTIEELQTSKATHTIEFKSKTKVILNADKAKIGQVLYNLISNAIKYSPDANHVIVSTKKQKDTITVSIRDFGMGISQESINKLFTPFFRATDTQREAFPSMGLGLYISSEIVKHYGGNIWVESKEGNGSTFSFTLPIKRSKIYFPLS
jgi:PAS domain S-box-containing protein